ncbi:uncharacterized protein LOC112570133 [Pomacea canaliculata]|uniref:uncharacterized protein LOC112570133 n=1 Tax=Pomacea canaliculata TaxID=400727 RepID=UPI000D72DB79|nr:uncharacterized protein LOC112570133 [Pomacea canaliculata]XP_025104192.1 uncharacterized protein LOC112570133 [Pomacea canaliculata]XP_025104202.1 uncharacterized protein LOC112570133 [Pomacea canaliculata]XP_025104210.1 uncharacterized protein LOC112570133 [Pomacea canaliculata]
MVPGKEDVKQNDDCSKQHEKKIGTILPHGKSSSPNSRCEDKPRQNQLVLEVVQPDMTQYLKMTPAERGLLLPSYMKAERLCNGAVKYTRTTDPLKNNTFHLTDNFSSPSGRCRLPAIETKMQLTTYNDHNTSDAVNSALWPSEKLKIKDFLADTNSEESIKITAAPLFCNFSKLPDLRAAPKIGDFIAYKVLELGEDYMPRISEYKVGFFFLFGWFFLL